MVYSEMRLEIDKRAGALHIGLKTTKEITLYPNDIKELSLMSHLLIKKVMEAGGVLEYNALDYVKARKIRQKEKGIGNKKEK
ncbi:hypothetical protein GQR36_22345 [Enterococcus termitis]